MGFGQGYTPRESVKLPPGEYEAAILGAKYEQTKNGTPYLAIYVQIKGHPGAKPNTITFYDRPYAGEKEMSRWDERVTEFFDAFHLERRFPDDYRSWHGARGWVRCVLDKRNPEFSNLYPMREPAPAQPPEQLQSAYTPDYGAPEPASRQGAEQQEFPEDIPF